MISNCIIFCNTTASEPFHYVVLIDSLHYARTSLCHVHRKASAKTSSKLNKFLHSEVNLLIQHNEKVH